MSLRRRVIAAICTSALVGGVLSLLAPAAPAAAAGEYYPAPASGYYDVDGHGYGHGHGMSQYGAQGAATEGLDRAAIASFYYPGTTTTAVGDPPLAVQLTATVSSTVRIDSPPGLAMTVTDELSRAVSGGPAAPYRVVTDSGGLHVQTLSAGSWQPFAVGGTTTLGGSVLFSTADGTIVYAADGSARNYRDSARVARTSSTQSTAVNVVTMQHYLYGVVPAESPSWFLPAALQAQAVAARTYALFKVSGSTGAPWNICDTTSCQVYGGRAKISSSGASTSLEYASTNTAVDATLGEALYYGGTPAFTEFGSSNGGWSAYGGKPYLIAREDPYDGIPPQNTGDDWTAKLYSSTLTSYFPQVGTLTGIRVLARDGNGEWGGRITSLQVEGTKGVAVSSDPRFGLMSNWWRPQDLHLPVGAVDSSSVAGVNATVNGWTYDSDSPTTSVTVQLYLDGAFVRSALAGLSRPDVAAAFPGVGPAHGYSISTAAPAGSHTLCIYAVNIGAGSGNPQLGCQSVTIDPAALRNPVGSLDDVTVSAGTVSPRGWMFDPDVPTVPGTVHVYVDGAIAGAFTANRSRPDVGLVYPGVGDRHGFDVDVPAAAGTHSVCVYAINAGPGNDNPLLGCRDVVVPDPRPSPDPVGVLDAAVVSGRVVTVSGWVFDPDAPDRSSSVRIYVDSTLVTTVVADLSRPDAAAAFPTATLRHGYSAVLDVHSGPHSVCVYGVNLRAGTTDPLLGCATVTVAAASWNPLGALDGATTSRRNLTVNGWMFDPDALRTPGMVHIYVDGTFVLAVKANEERPDVEVVFPGVGTHHGFLSTFRVTEGPHQVCVYGINTGDGSGNPVLGCATVVATT